MNSVILFDLGKADIKEPGKETLRKIGTLIKQLNKNAVIQGHTDNLPINTMLFLPTGSCQQRGQPTLYCFLSTNAVWIRWN